METYNVVITGKTPLLMHHDNIEWADFMDEWKNENKKTSKAGDDRTPAWRWIGCTYHDGKVLGVPSANIMRCLMEGGAQVPVPGGKMGKTFKAQTQSGMMCVESLWPLAVRGQTIAWGLVEQLREVPKFHAQKKAVQDLGFDLLVKRAKIGTSKHIRVRPQFDTWELRGSIVVWDEQIDDKALTQIFSYAGRYKGLGDWRPGAKTPGPYGTFEASIS